MRYLQSAIMGITMFAMIISLSGLACAEMRHCATEKGKDASAAHIKVLRDSATALAALNPVLAKGLSDLADKKAEEMKKWQEWKDTYDAKTKLLKDSSAVLKTLNPALAQELETMSEEKHMKKEAMEKEGAGD